MKLFFHARYKYIFLSHCRYFCVSSTSFRVFFPLLFFLYFSASKKQRCDVTVVHFLSLVRLFVSLLFLF